MKPLSNSEFIAKCAAIHGNQYDYSHTDYVNRTTPVIITCPAHGDFTMLPTTHYRSGCRKCSADKQRKPLRDVVKDFRQTHGPKYDYSEVKYVNSRTKICIICPIHGCFYQRPHDHQRGDGCPTCGERGLKDVEHFIRKSKSTHGVKYDYSQSEYTSTNDKVKVICPTHGAFYVKPYHHYSGVGCPSCAPSNYSQLKEGFLYVLLESRRSNVFKVGISNHVFDRVRSLKLTTPHSFSVECVYRHESGAVAKICEKLIHEHFDKEGYVGFNGSSEWLTCNENNWVDVIQHITTMFGMEKFRYE